MHEDDEAELLVGLVALLRREQIESGGGLPGVGGEQLRPGRSGGQRGPKAQRREIICDVAHLYPAPQDIGFGSMIPIVGSKALRPVRPRLYRMLHPDFREFPFHDVRE
jgi:hypothetical protein